MTRVYVNTILPSDELSSENFSEALTSYAKKLEKLAKVFLKFSSFVNKHKIQVKEVDGFANSGTFELDEIDAGRLKKAGLVVDYSEIEEEPEIPAFYIDKQLDAVLEETAQNIENSMLEFNAPKSLTVDFPEFPDVKEETVLTFNLVEVLNADLELDNDVKPGHMILKVMSADEESRRFNLIMIDFYSDPSEFKLDRERMVFCYRDKDSEVWNEKPISEVFRSLKIVNALLSNIVLMASENPYLFEALGSLDQDLRFLQQWLAFDYAIDENEEEDLF